MSARRWRRAAALIARTEQTRAEIGRPVEVMSEGGFLVLRLRQPAEPPLFGSADAEPIALCVPGLTAVPWAGGAIDVRIDPVALHRAARRSTSTASCYPSSCAPPLVGDRFCPLGLEGKSQALADFFRGRHVRGAERRRTPIVCDQNGILWVVGHRIANRVKLTEASRRTLGLAWVAEPISPARTPACRVD